MVRQPGYFKKLSIGAILLTVCPLPSEAGAASHKSRSPSTQSQLARINAALQRQSQQLLSDEARIAEQDRLIQSQAADLAKLKLQDNFALATNAAPQQGGGQSHPVAKDESGSPATQVTPVSQSASLAAISQGPVGEAPDTQTKTADVGNALPQGLAVLTPRHKFIFEPSIEYDRSGANRLVFEGVEIVPGLQLGLLDANSVERDLVVATGAVRYGLTDRLELEVRAPFVYRRDQITTLAQQVTTSTAPVNQTQSLKGANIGDIEATLRYQINQGLDNRPVVVATMRVKSDSGVGPYDVRFNSGGVALSSATGSGFWGVEPGLTILAPTDPVVLFANVGYLKNFARDIDKTIGATHVGRVDPGDSIDAGFGFGFALNPAFSFSLGYSNSYVFGTRQTLGNTRQRSNDLEVGALTMGWSYRFNNGYTLGNNLEFGVTPDAPNLRVVFRTPLVF